MNGNKQAILVTAADLAPQALDLLKDFDVVFAGPRPQESDILALIKKHDPVGIIVRYGRISAAAIDAGRSLKVISKHGSGIDTIDSQAAKAHKVAVCAAVGVNAAAVAEHAITLMLACAKSVVKMNSRMHAGHWDKASHKSIELRGRTLGLIGLGAIGARTALIAHAMELNVIAYDPYAKQAPDYVRLAGLDEIWRAADIISLHCPLTAENRNLINAQTLDQCKPGIIIVNTARGGLIDEDALLAAVHNGRVGAAALDSFQQEPPPATHPFFKEEKILLSPHIGGVTQDAYVNMGVAAARNLLSQLA
ncbi:hydroxyacid dehydrogenase [Candidimonas nitroreducens]|uniref:3-phosphoglycerate dehydrogenase n=1 Tax=Candidimonas nitroreducens TaxID=683354 RepID=A0A225MX04_9BURK|nr:hydroxyacid dehydrogenase [Candidimonas nitroreducens]OWT64101.1 3-phosphoglycerate dehydrogenase [Candidimonas nitroreducens]